MKQVADKVENLVKRLSVMLPSGKDNPKRVAVANWLKRDRSNVAVACRRTLQRYGKRGDEL